MDDSNIIYTNDDGIYKGTIQVTIVRQNDERKTLNYAHTKFNSYMLQKYKIDKLYDIKQFHNVKI